MEKQTDKELEDEIKKNIVCKELSKRINKAIIESYKVGYDEGFKEEVTQKGMIKIEDVNKMIDKTKNPYPTDIFPELELSEFQSHTINDFLCSNLRITLDCLSAELMRRARNNLKEELKQSLKELGEK